MDELTRDMLDEIIDTVEPNTPEPERILIYSDLMKVLNRWSLLDGFD